MRGCGAPVGADLDHPAGVAGLLGEEQRAGVGFQVEPSMLLKWVLPSAPTGVSRVMRCSGIADVEVDRG